MQQALIVIGLVLSLLIPSYVFAKEYVSPLALAKNFNGKMESTAYWVSEKLDGIRCYWDGTTLHTRNGKEIHAPQWFIEQLPKTPLDGELWAGRGGYQTVSKTVLDKTPNNALWQNIEYKVFDLPNSKEPFEIRQEALKHLVQIQQSAILSWVEQTKSSNLDEINKKLAKVIKNGGEGLMLRPEGSFYQAGRSANLMKLKQRQDSEARVIAYQAGRGKYENMMGAVWVELENGKMFKIGSGFSVDERKTPPPIGSDITFTHQGFTDRGLPRFASYERVKLPE